MKIIADTHTHTIYSGDAQCTLLENLRAAKEKGLKYLCMTDHVNIPRAADPEYFTKLVLVPREYEGMRLVRGVETNITDYEGHVDMPDNILAGLDWVIASLHSIVLPPSDVQNHTKCWQAIAENPLIDVIGHCGDPKYRFDIDPTVKKFGQCGKIVEINSHSFVGRKGADVICREVALTCMKYEVPVVVSSDAHFVSHIGWFDDALNMLDSINFPEELILNADEERFAAVIEKKYDGNKNF